MKTKTGNFFTRIAAVALSIAVACPYAYAVDIGKVTYTDGRVDVVRQNSDIATPLREGDAISVGDAVRTKSDSKAEVTFNDKSVLRIAQNSKIEVKDYVLDSDNKRKTANIMLERGKARTIIAKMADKAEFCISTPNAFGTVKGSDVYASYQAGSSSMLVAEGQLSILNPLYPKDLLVIPAGNSVIVPADAIPQGPRAFLDLEKKMQEKDTSIPTNVVRSKDATTIKGAFASMSGDVKVKSKGADSFRKAILSDTLGEGDMIETGTDGIADIRFDNGNGLSLKPSTSITITKLIQDPKTGQYENKFEVSMGKVRARIEKLKETNSTFEVKTPTAICGARGTLMYIEITPTNTKVFFEGGVGDLRSLITGLRMAVEMGYAAYANGNGDLSEAYVPGDGERLDWTGGWDPGNGTEGYSSGGGTIGIFFDDGKVVGVTNVPATETELQTFFSDPLFAESTLDGEEETAPTELTFDSSFGCSISGQFVSLDKETGFEYDDETSITALFTGFGAPWEAPSTTILVGTYLNNGNLNIWMTGNEPTELNIEGGHGLVVAGGVGGNDGMFKSLLGGFYLRENPEGEGYRVGVLISELAGAYFPSSKSFLLLGDTTSYFDTPTSLTPEAFVDGEDCFSSSWFEGGITGPTAHGAIEGEIISIDEGEQSPLWAFWRMMSAGSYEGDMQENMRLFFRAVDYYDGEDEAEMDAFLLGEMELDSSSNGTLEGALSGIILTMDYDYDQAPVIMGGSFDGSVLGSFSEGKWQSLGMGVAEITNEMLDTSSIESLEEDIMSLGESAGFPLIVTQTDLLEGMRCFNYGADSESDGFNLSMDIISVSSPENTSEGLFVGIGSIDSEIISTSWDLAIAGGDIEDGFAITSFNGNVWTYYNEASEEAFDRLFGTIGGQFLSRTEYRTIDGMVGGSLDADEWKLISVGTYANKPLFWSSTFKAYESRFNDSAININEYSIVTAIIGALEPILPDGYSDAVVMGRVSIDSESSAVWWGRIEGSYAGDGSVLTEGFIAGKYDMGNIEGSAIAIFIDALGNAGILKGSFKGYEQNMADGFWSGDGYLEAKKYATGFDPMNPSEHLQRNPIDGNLAGTIGDIGVLSSPGTIPSISWGLLSSNTVWLEKSGVAEPWGIYSIELGGMHTAKGGGSDWKLNLAGKNWTKDGTYWMASAIGTENKGFMDGDLNGVFFESMDNGNVKMGTIEGDVNGYVDVPGETGTWQAISTGEWVEVTDLLDQTTMFGTNGIEELNRFVNVPITEVYSLTQVSAGSIASGVIVQNLTDFINFAFSLWDNSQWVANYSGSTGGTAITGQAGGTYGSGAFSGVGAGINQDILNTVAVAGNYGSDGAISNTTANVVLYTPTVASTPPAV